VCGEGKHRCGEGGCTGVGRGDAPVWGGRDLPSEWELHTPAVRENIHKVRRQSSEDYPIVISPI